MWSNFMRTYVRKPGFLMPGDIRISLIKTCRMFIADVYNQGRTQNLMWVGSFQEKVDLFDGAGVQSTPSMQSMLKLGGLGACPPGKI